MRATRIAGAAVCAVTLAACGSIADQTPALKMTTDVMAGRWILAAPNAPTCGINFNGASGVQEGTLVPEGGCPERFFLIRTWALSQNMLLLRDDSGQPLAQLAFANGVFSGISAAGTPLTLSRQIQ
jgi:Protease inhibitor Inh